MNYKGPSVFSEPESKALKAFVERHQFKTNLILSLIWTNRLLV